MESRISYPKLDESCEVEQEMEDYEIVDAKDAFGNVSDYSIYFSRIMISIKNNKEFLMNLALKLLIIWLDSKKVLDIQKTEALESKSPKKLDLEKQRADRKVEIENLVMELEENNRKFDMDTEQNIQENSIRIEKFLKDQTASLKRENFTKKQFLEIEKIRKSCQSSKTHEEIRRREIQKQNEEADSQRRKINEKLEEDIQDLQNQEESRRRGVENQIQRFQKVLETKMANDVMEKNWTERLNKLRNSFKDLENSENLKKEISRQKVFLEFEKLEMRKMYEATGKTFLLDIEEKIAEILEESERLAYVVENEPGNKERIRGCFSALKKVTLEIPTLAELKRIYKEENDF